jgi:hypothetical protein
VIHGHQAIGVREWKRREHGVMEHGVHHADAGDTGRHRGERRE